MVRGLDQFSRHFEDFKEQYIIIGATACSLAFAEADQEFRITRDIDMVLIVEALSREFVHAFWRFV